MIANLSLKMKTSLLTLIGMLFIFVTGFIGYNGIVHMNEDVTQLHRTVVMSQELCGLTESFQRTRINLRDATEATNQEEFTKAVEKLKELRSKSTEHVEAMEKTTHLQEFLVLIKELNDARGQYGEVIDRVIALKTQGQNAEALAEIHGEGKIKALHEQEIIDKMMAVQKKAAIDGKVDSEAAYDKSIYEMIASIIIAIAVATIVGSIIIRVLNSEVNAIKIGLLSFFRFLNRESDNVELIDLKSEDEFGQMAKVINENIETTSNILTKDAQAICVVEETAEQIALRFVSVRIHAETGSAETKMAIDAINKMLESLEEALSTSSTILASYARSNYTANVEIGRYSGEIGGMLMALKALGESTGDFMALVGKNGNALNHGSETLAMASENLSTAANQQASSLEETAAAIEELTSNISANSQKASEMATLARETENAANSGKALADNTVSSMNEISKATHAINEAVNIIENIAFQTNILSLNAAVEAATAGEAGKGFAVVAQEVRNLANRSADAASQIKELAELANSKSQDGLRVSEEMMKGFDVINQKITQTTQLVQDVANGSREQMAGINQINTAVTQLDQMTQQNAQSANAVNSLSTNILQMAQSLQDTASKTVYYPESENRVCRIDMMFDTTKLKLDHVLFKNNNFAKLKDQRVSAWTVTNESQCDLGKWIQAHSHESFAQGSGWNELLSYHAHVHQKVQEFVNMKASGRMTNDLQKRLSLEIEQDTAKVFEALNHVRNEACRHEPTKEIIQQAKKHSPQSTKSNSGLLSTKKSSAVLTNSKKVDDEVWENF